MSREKETILTINKLIELIEEKEKEPNFFLAPGCLIGILSDIALSLARIADTLSKGET